MPHTVAELTVASLIENGVDTLYCLPGVQNDPFFDALYHRRQEITAIPVRHEQTAVYMAMGAAAATGRPQAFCVVPGPGFLNGTAALSTAYALNAPVFGVVGQIPTTQIGQQLGVLHEINDQFAIMGQLTKHAEQILSAQSAPVQLRAAWDAIHSGRPRPVAVEVPADVWEQETEFDISHLRGERTAPPPPDSEQIARAAQLITDAECPLIVIGSGAQEHAEAIFNLAYRISAGVVAHRTGHGVLPLDDFLAMSMPAAHHVWPECDLVIGLGTRLFEQKGRWGVDHRLRILHIDIDAGTLHRLVEPTIGIHADLADALPQLLAALPEEQPDRGEWMKQVAIANALTEARARAELGLTFQWISAMRQGLPPEGIFVAGMTQLGYSSWFLFPTYMPRTFISTGYQGTLGFSIPTGLGAAHARRDVPVLATSGDGGALYAIGELATAKQYDIPLNIVVFNNDAYGNVRTNQRDRYGGRIIASELINPDFVALAQSFGVNAVRAETPEALRSEIEKAVAHRGPNLIEVPIGELPPSLPFTILPRVRGNPS